MKKPACILLLALAFPASQAALAEGPAQVVTPSDDLGELPNKLNTFVQDAIDEGLLTPARPQVLVPPRDPQAPGEVQQLALRPKHDATEDVCSRSNPLDFSAYGNLASYGDLMAWRKAAAADAAGVTATALAKAYLVLGLNEEARMQLDGSTDPDAKVLRRFAHLMEGRKAPETAFFAELAACHEEAGVWLAVAQLSSGDPAGAETMERHVNTFRKLPALLRAHAASVAIPALSGSGGRLLAEKLMVDFTDADIAASTELTFTKALFDMSTGNAEAEATLRQFLHRPEYRRRAVSSLLMNGRKVDRVYQDEVAGDVVGELGSLSREDSVAANLDTMLKDLKGVAGYAMTLELAAMPATQSDEAQARLAAHFMTMLDRDLASDDPLQNLSAMENLLEGKALLASHPEREPLLRTATSKAIELGFRSLADRFAAEMQADDAIAAAQADLAFQMVDHDRLKTLAHQYPGNPDVVRIAALSAIRSNDKALLASLEGRLSDDDETVLALIEFDASSQHWIAPQSLYDAARRLEGEEVEARVARVLALRDESLRHRRARERYAMSEIGPSLARIGETLDDPAMEMR